MSITWHSIPPAAAVEEVGSDVERGLARDEVARRAARHGPNALPEAERPSTLAIIGRQVASPLIGLLLLAAIIALALGHVGDAAVVAVVVVLNAIIGAVQEGRAERSLAALRRLAGHPARVVRDGAEAVIEAREVVPGDVILLAAGDAVPADARLVDGASLHIAEAALTGESVPVAKDLIPLAPDTPLADRRNMVYAGTHVTAGRARAVVVATGLATEIGHIATLAEASKPPPTPLERRVSQLGRTISVVAIALFLVIVGAGWLRGLPMGEVVMVGISQLVGMVPEGLPVAMTIALAVGVQRMAKRGAIVRRLSAVETLGSTTVICTDKTGTLTRNEMTLTAVALPTAGRTIEVSGVGYQPDGAFAEGGAPLDAGADPALREILVAGVLCNDADVASPTEDEPRWTAIGDPTEAAFVVAAIKAGLVPSELRRERPRRAELPFDSETKMMATQHGEGPRARIVVKGAPEEVLALCRAARGGDGEIALDDGARAAVRRSAEGMAAGALRVLALAVLDGQAIDGERGFEALRGRLVLLGLVGQIDPPRPEVRDAVARCRAAGIRPVVVTGDHAVTGLAVARDLGIASEGDVAIDGAELSRMDDDDLAARLGQVAVFARVHPAQKLRIVEAYRRRGEVVAMTGDGVNDAPALVSADVGVAMGRTGTEVAKEAAKIVLTDDDFTSVVAAVEEGRVAYRNITKAILLLIATSAAEVIVLLAAMMLGYPPPFAAVQILWNNLITEGVITVNLVMDPAEGDEMRRPPVHPGESFLKREMLVRLAVMTPVIVASTLGWFLVRTAAGVPHDQVQTETFTLLAVCEWFNVLNCRSAVRSALRLDVVQNRWLLGGLVVGNLLQVLVVFSPPMNRIFHTVPLDLDVAVWIGVVGSAVLWVEEARKLVVRALERRGERSPLPAQ